MDSSMLRDRGFELRWSLTARAASYQSLCANTVECRGYVDSRDTDFTGRLSDRTNYTGQCHNDVMWKTAMLLSTHSQYA